MADAGAAVKSYGGKKRITFVAGVELRWRRHRSQVSSSYLATGRCPRRPTRISVEPPRMVAEEGRSSDTVEKPKRRGRPKKSTTTTAATPSTTKNEKDLSTEGSESSGDKPKKRSRKTKAATAESVETSTEESVPVKKTSTRKKSTAGSKKKPTVDIMAEETNAHDDEDLDPVTAMSALTEIFAEIGLKQDDRSTEFPEGNAEETNEDVDDTYLSSILGKREGEEQLGWMESVANISDEGAGLDDEGTTASVREKSLRGRKSKKNLTIGESEEEEEKDERYWEKMDDGVEEGIEIRNDQESEDIAGATDLSLDNLPQDEDLSLFTDLGIEDEDDDEERLIDDEEDFRIFRDSLRVGLGRMLGVVDDEDEDEDKEDSDEVDDVDDIDDMEDRFADDDDDVVIADADVEDDIDVVDGDDVVDVSSLFEDVDAVDDDDSDNTIDVPDDLGVVELDEEEEEDVDTPSGDPIEDMARLLGLGMKDGAGLDLAVEDAGSLRRTKNSSKVSNPSLSTSEEVVLPTKQVANSRGIIAAAVELEPDLVDASNDAADFESSEGGAALPSGKKLGKVALEVTEDDDDYNDDELFADGDDDLEEDEDEQLKSLEDYDEDNSDEIDRMVDDLTAQSEVEAKVLDLNDDEYITVTEGPDENYGWGGDGPENRDQHLSAQTAASQTRMGFFGITAEEAVERGEIVEGGTDWFARRVFEVSLTCSDLDMLKWTKGRTGPPVEVEKLLATVYPQPKLGPIISRPTMMISLADDLDDDVDGDSADIGDEVDTSLLFDEENSIELFGDEADDLV